MNEPLLLLLIVTTSYFAAHVIFDRLARRFTLVSGAEYLVLGLLLGPQVGGLLPPSVVESFSPLITLGLGWMGARAGTQLVLRALVRIPAATYRVAMAEVALTSLFLGGVAFAVLRWGTGMATEQATVIACALALVALPSSAAGVRVVAETQGRHDALVRQLDVATVLQGIVASAGLAVMFAIVHDAPTRMPRALVPTEWLAITIAIGVVGGTLFHIFIGDERKVDRLFISLAGGIILVSGAAAALRLSPVFAAMVFGIILGNSRDNRAEIVAALSRVEKPFYFVLLIFAGASWEPGEGDWLLPVIALVVLRPFARIGSARLAARLNGLVPLLGTSWGRGLIGHGGFALVLAFDYLRRGTLPGRNMVFTVAVASLLLTDVVSARLIRSVLRRVEGSTDDDVERDVKPGAGPGSTGETLLPRGSR